MRCPGCHEQTISIGAKVRVALRANVECPACGIAVRLGQRSRLVQTLAGEAVLLLGFASALYFGMPALLVASAACWLGFAIALPLTEGPAASRGDHGPEK